MNVHDEDETFSCMLSSHVRKNTSEQGHTEWPHLLCGRMAACGTVPLQGARLRLPIHCPNRAFRRCRQRQWCRSTRRRLWATSWAGAGYAFSTVLLAISPQGFPPLSPATVVPQYTTQIVDNKPDNRPVPSVLEQCVAEQRYVRESMTRTLLYAQVRSFISLIHSSLRPCCGPLFFGSPSPVQSWRGCRWQDAGRVSLTWGLRPSASTAAVPSFVCMLDQNLL